MSWDDPRRMLLKIQPLAWLILLAAPTAVLARPDSLMLISETTTTRAVALESITLRKQPFALTTSPGFSADRRTRISIFAMNVDLLPGEGRESFSADAEDVLHNHYPLFVEYVGEVPSLHYEGVYMINLRLNDSLGEDLGDVLVRLEHHGVASNRVRIGLGHLGGGPADDIGAVPTPAPASLRQLWDGTVKQYLKDPLWIARDMEDAGNNLMVPLQAAFQLGELEWQRDFSEHFNRFVKADPAEIGQDRLARLNYLYLASRFCVLAKRANHEDLIPPALPTFLGHEVERMWTGEPAWQWDTPSFPGGVRERILWKLNQRSTNPSYYRAIVDEDLYVLAVGVDLSSYNQLMGRPDTMSDVVDIAFRSLKQEGVFQESGWLFQPGVWVDHPAYADSLSQATDSSHSHRWPFWLSSFVEARPQEKIFIQTVKDALTKQFVGKVLIPASTDFPVPRTKNFMDGANGLFRDYGPYELSGTLTYGYWGYLGDPRINEVFTQLSRSFPLPESALQLYRDKTTREVHPLKAGWLVNGFAELCVRLTLRF